MPETKADTGDKARRKHYSKKVSAVSHRTTVQLYKSVGLHLKKLYLGNDALQKLTVIFEQQHGEKLDVDNIDPVLVGDVLSYCINACYNFKSTQAKTTEVDPPIIKAAKTPAGQRLYRYHQMAQGTPDLRDADGLVNIFNACNKRGKRYFPHIDGAVERFKFCKPKPVDTAWDGEENDDGIIEGIWTTLEIQALRSEETVKRLITQWNGPNPDTVKRSKKHSGKRHKSTTKTGDSARSKK